MNADLERLLNGVQVAAVICNQWGDTGKGKFADYFSAEWADVVARGTGGNNAGHTVVVGDEKRVFHLLPAGITQDDRGVVNVLGKGMVIDCAVLNEELDALTEQGYTYDNLVISQDAHVILPDHVMRDGKNKNMKKGGIGSTGRGIGPCYADRTARFGIRMRDMVDTDRLDNALQRLMRHHPDIGRDAVIAYAERCMPRLVPHVRNADAYVQRAHADGKRILLEGAQGLLLSIDHGTYPYVTSSDPSLNGTANGVGLSARAVDLPLGIIKFPFMTRVGAGPFPTELGGRRSEEYCADADNHKLPQELADWGIPHTDGVYDTKDPAIMDMIRSSDPFVQGIGLRLCAGEYGATTARPRRVGWTDGVAGRYAVGKNGPIFVLTKVDCLAGAPHFALCESYEHDNRITDEFDPGVLYDVEPYLRWYEGYGDISDVASFDGLPDTLRCAIDDFQEMTGGYVAIVSTGADREQTIVR